MKQCCHIFCGVCVGALSCGPSPVGPSAVGPHLWGPHLVCVLAVGLHEDEGVEEVGGDDVRDEGSGLFLKNHGHDVIPDRSFFFFITG